jgi:hypothetical protein
MQRVFARFAIPLFFSVIFLFSFQAPWGFCGEIVNTVNSLPGVYPHTYPASIDLRPPGHDLIARPLIVVRRQLDYVETDPEPEADDFDRTGSNRRVGLTPEEYKQFQELMVLKRPGPLELAVATFASRGAAFSIGVLAWIGVLLLLRRPLRDLWDRDVEGNAYASAAVICVVIYATSQIIMAVVG